MTTRALLLALAALALLPAAAIAGDHSGDYGHQTVGADNNDNAGNADPDCHKREASDTAEAGNASGRRVAEDGRYTVNKDGFEHHGDFGND